jgi:phosphonate transport system substrate-binding protein
MKTVNQLSVCPHDTAKNLAGWYLLNTYLQRKLECDIHFNLQHDFIAEREAVLAGGHHIVYANPYSVLEFAEKLDFIPVARPIGVFDETLLIARKGTNLADSAALKVSTATKCLIVHALGCMELRKLGKDPSAFEFILTGNHLNAANAVIKGDADVGFVFNETWNGMSASSRESLEIIAESNQRDCYHCFCVSPQWQDRKEKVRDVLVGMHNDHDGGSHILEELKFKGFEPAPEDTISQLKAIVKQGELYAP